jgi:hypothetical protein
LRPKIDNAWKRLKKTPKKREIKLIEKQEIERGYTKEKASEARPVGDKESSHKVFNENILKKQLAPKSIYLIAEKQSKTSFDIFQRSLKNGYRGLCISRTNPKIINKSYKLNDSEIYWLTTFGGPNTFSPTALNEMFGKINEYISRNEKSIILLEGISFIIANTSFTRTFNLLEYLKDSIAVGSSIIIVPMNTDVIDKKQREQLESEFIILDGWRDEEREISESIGEITEETKEETKPDLKKETEEENGTDVKKKAKNAIKEAEEAFKNLQKAKKGGDNREIAQAKKLLNDSKKKARETLEKVKQTGN